MKTGRYSSSETTAGELAKYLLAIEGNILILANGAMASGKTTFTRMLGRALGIAANITSPTFVGLHEYKGQGFDFLHFDIYQVPLSYYDIKELLLRNASPKILFIEWAEKLDTGTVDKLKLEGIRIINLKFSVDSEEHFIDLG